MSTCDISKCPMDAVFDVAEELANEYPEPNGNVALGGIALGRKALQAMRTKIECPGVSQNQQSGQIDCPLREIVYGARGQGTGLWQTGQYRIPLDKVVQPQESRNHGTYL